MWIYVASPDEPGHHPVVVYGHGQGASNLLPECVAESAPPTHVDVAPSLDTAEALAAAGYVGVAVFYRSYGTPPELGTMTFRDHFVLDARSMLTAAGWVRDHHPKASARAAFAGNSMGSFTATWAVSPHPALHDLQEGLDIGAAIASGMLGNHIANSSPQFRQIDDASLDDQIRAASIVLFTQALVGLRASQAGLTTVDSASADGLTGDLTPLGRRLFEALFIDPPPDIPECGDAQGRPVWCSSSCVSKLAGDLFLEGAGGAIQASDWFTSATIDDFAYWNPPTDIDPTAPDGSLLALLRALSPAYSLPGPLLTPRFLPLVSTADHTLPAQTSGSTAPGELYIDQLRSVGANIPDPPLLVTEAGCDHGDYYRPERPGCGWSLVLEHLSAAFAR